MKRKIEYGLPLIYLNKAGENPSLNPVTFVYSLPHFNHLDLYTPNSSDMKCYHTNQGNGNPVIRIDIITLVDVSD